VIAAGSLTVVISLSCIACSTSKYPRRKQRKPCIERARQGNSFCVPHSCGRRKPGSTGPARGGTRGKRAVRAQPLCSRRWRYGSREEKRRDWRVPTARAAFGIASGCHAALRRMYGRPGSAARVDGRRVHGSGQLGHFTRRLRRVFLEVLCGQVRAQDPAALNGRPRAAAWLGEVIQCSVSRPAGTPLAVPQVSILPIQRTDSMMSQRYREALAQNRTNAMPSRRVSVLLAVSLSLAALTTGCRKKTAVAPPAAFEGSWR
jgi:hypothetical protein